MSSTFQYAASGARGDLTLSGSLTIASMSLSWSWGSQPATANIVFVGDVTDPASGLITAATPVVVGAFSRLDVGSAHTFWGVVKGVHAHDGSGGKEITVSWVDHREFLQWDVVYGQFNLPDNFTSLVGLVPTRVRRWKHMLPDDVSAQVWSYTAAPLSAEAILNYLFTAPTVESAWVRQYHPVMSTASVYALDFSAGTHLANAISSVSDRLGLVFTLVDAFTLRWRRKGQLVTSGSHADSNMPWAASPFPLVSGNFVFPVDTGGHPAADDCRDGTAVSGQASRVLISGDRNLYQVLNLSLVADWPAGWNEFWDESVFVNWVYAHGIDPSSTEAYSAITGDSEHIIGWQLASARAQRMTVTEFSDLRQSVSGDGANFIDYRKFAGLARFDMPVALYLRNVVWRAYRLPDTILGRYAQAWRLESKALCSVTYNTSGVMTADPTTPVDGAGYAIAQGFGFNSSEAFKALNPDRFNLSDWVDTNSAWTPMSFQVDPDGGDGIGFIIFDAPVISAADAYVSITSGAATFGVPNAAPTFTPAPVVASLTLAGERFEYLYPPSSPAGVRDDSVHEAALFREVVVDADATVIGEILYSDGASPYDKADELGGAYVRDWYFREGGFTRFLDPADGGVQLNGLIDRVSVSVSSSGIQEEVDFTVERASAAFEPERNYDRRLLASDLFPGQRELRSQADTAQAIARSLRQNPAMLRTLAQAFLDNLGISHTVPAKVTGGAGALDFGTVLWRDPAATAAVPPADVTSTHTVLQGVVVRHNEPIDGNLQVAQSGRVLAQVDGGTDGIAVGDSLGRLDGSAAFQKVDTGGVATARATVAASTTQTIWVDLAPAGGSGDITIKVITASSYTLQDDDRAKFLVCSALCTVTIPTGLGVGFGCGFIQEGTGTDQITVVADSGVALFNPDGQYKSRKPGASITLIRRDTDAYYLNGDTGP